MCDADSGTPTFLKVRSRWEKVGSGLGLLLGIIGFNLLLPFLFEKQAGFDGSQMLWAAVTALICSELGAISYVGLRRLSTNLHCQLMS
ncbi:hypothetical protein ACF2JD_06715 [Aeromonas sp. A-5]|uniref:hypothetical protein n=1 Tax=Aeromonas ichthyocola TaxID=3367746 RepID=UPI0038EB0D0E